MKIYTNPIDILLSGRITTLQNHLNETETTLGNVLSALLQMKEIINKIEKIHILKKDNNKVINDLVKELDSVVDRCERGNFKFLDGIFSKFNPRLSMWYRAGTGMHQKNRLYIPTMTSQALKLTDLNGETVVDQSVITYSKSRIKKAEADINAYINCINHIKFFNKRDRPYMFNVLFLEKNIMENQLNFLHSVDKSLLSIFNILNRLRELSDSYKKQSDKEIHLQVEVSELVEEVDRIASQSSFNRFIIMAGDFADRNPRASMWFLAPGSSNGLKRIYIITMTANSLYLKKEGWVKRRISDSDMPQKLDDAIKRVTEERERIQGYITYFNKEGDFNREIKIQIK